MTATHESAAPSRAENWAMALMPAAFVFLWSTGFAGARLGLPHIEPLSFVALRMAISAVAVIPILMLMRAPWPRSWAEAGHIAAAGLLMNAMGIGSMFTVMSTGMPLALVALIGALQPLLTGLLAGPLLGERVRPVQWVGLALGLAGVALTLWEKLGAGTVWPPAVALAFVGLSGFTLGTLYQKRFCAGMNLWTGSAIQYAAPTAVVGVLAVAVDTRPIDWAPELIFAALWLALVCSLGAMTLLWLLVRRGAASKVASLFYLTPPVTAVLAWAMFGETLGPLALVGMGVAAAGVALVTRPVKFR
ncbi:MAG: DMT family transporter [Hyphomicrobiales bacterium]|nr:DMT family transporter [Hyphomicrobiales bacterium]